MARGRNNGGDRHRRRRRRHGAAPGDQGRHLRREDGNDRAWKDILEATFRIRLQAFGLAVAVLPLLVAIHIGFILESSTAVWAAYAGFIGTLSSLGAILFVPRHAMGGLITIGLVFFFVTLISLVIVSLT